MSMLNQSWTVLFVCVWKGQWLNICVCVCVCVCICSCFSIWCCLPDVYISGCSLFSSLVSTNYSEPLFSHTQPLQSVNASPLTSQGCCLCTVLLCHRRLVPLGLCTLIPLSFLGAGPVFSQGSFLCEPAQPLSLSGRHSPSPHTPNTMALKCENLKTKGPPASFEACCKTSKSQRT